MFGWLRMRKNQLPVNEYLIRQDARGSGVPVSWTKAQLESTLKRLSQPFFNFTGFRFNSVRQGRTRGLIACTALIGLLFGCASLPEAPENQCQRIPVGPGPEDFALDLSGGPGSPRILVSSHERREWQPGEIFEVDLDPGSGYAAQALPRRGEPEGLFFAPHGMDVREVDGQHLLYVISHGSDEVDGAQHILVYRILPEALDYLGSVASEFFFSPNDLAIDATGSFYVSNDSRNRGSLMEMALSLSWSSVVHCKASSIQPGPLAAPASTREDCILAAEELASANGVAIQRSPDGKGDSGTVFVSTSRGNSLYVFHRDDSGRLVDRKRIFEAPILDNLFFVGHGQKLLVASHPSALAFLRHVSNGSNESPSVIYSVQIDSGAAEAVYANSGKELSAASGAFIYKEQLFISQVFEPFLLRCQLPGQ
ncbi:MAG: hypothetical protein CMN76_13965 [Spirochaetaceae bacterium]|nr:hypothetical protein [Spirochaetaceae bacterium]